MPNFISNLFSSEAFMPHGHCYLWQANILWTHVISDAIIAMAYATIPFALIYLVRKRKDLAFNWIFVMFGIFILACGATHLMNIWTVWDPVYRLTGLVKAVTALASIGTAITLWPLIPRVLVLPSPSQLREANESLHLEIVERKRAEEALEERNRALVEAEKLKSEFVANVSHELRTPLTLILAPIETLLVSPESANLPESSLKSLATIHGNALRLLQMVNSLLDFSKLEANKMEVKREPTDIVRITQAILADFEPIMAVKGIQGHFTSEPPSIIAAMDRPLYERILFNLLSNAVKFTNEQGSISVDLAYKKGRLQLKVSDTGIGISEEDQKHLFQKFRQLEGSSNRRYEGTGLGLTLVKSFSELLDGQVSVRSRPGEGSSFTVELSAPAAAAETVHVDSQHIPRFQAVLPKNESKAQDKKPHIDASLPRVLIAEDNSELSTYISAAIEDICQTKTASNGDEALSVLQDWPPDLIISDVMMPERDGLSLCRTIKKNADTLHIPVVLLTALTHREALIRGWEAGADEYLFKPFHPTELITRVKTLLEGAAARKEAEKHRLGLVRETVAREEAERNVQRLEKIEAELRRTNKLKDEFLAMVSHELRTPMNAILGWCELLVEQQIDEAEYYEIFNILYRSARAQARIIDDVLDMSNIITGKMKLHIEPVRLSTIITETVDSMRLAAQSKKLRLETALDHAAGMVGGDADRLRQVVWNLLSNAIKFSREGGGIQIVLEKEDSKVVLIIADQGEGIDPAFQPHIFERFLQEDTSLTRKFGGLGLGLSIVKYIVDSHGGRVEVQSPGKGFGATFKVILPILAVGEVMDDTSKGLSRTPAPHGDESTQQVL